MCDTMTHAHSQMWIKSGVKQAYIIGSSRTYRMRFFRLLISMWLSVAVEAQWAKCGFSLTTSFSCFFFSVANYGVWQNRMTICRRRMQSHYYNHIDCSHFQTSQLHMHRSSEWCNHFQSTKIIWINIFIWSKAAAWTVDTWTRHRNR